MEEYKLGALGDLISSTKSPGKGKAAQKHKNQSPNKSITHTKGTPKTQKRSLSTSFTKVTSIKKSRQEIPQSDDEDAEKEEDEDAEKEEDKDAENEESVNEDEAAEVAKSEDEEEESDSDDNNEDDESVDAEEEEIDDNAEDAEDSDDDQPEEQSSKPQQEKSMYNDRTIFVGNIKVGTQKKNVVKRFKKYGPIDSVRLRSIGVANPKLGQKLAIQKGTLHPDRETCNAYVRFKTSESANKAVEEENGKEFNGFHLRVTMADIKTVTHDNKKTLFVGNLSFKAEDEDLWKAFAPCGQIDSVRIVRNKPTNVSLGFAYVNFKSIDAVELAMQMGDVTINGRVLRLKGSDFTPKKEKTPRPSNDKCVFVTGIPLGTNKDEMKEAFASCGSIHKIRLIKDKKSGKPSGYGFITFETTEEAAKALAAKILIDNSEVEVQLPKRSLKSMKGDKTGNQNKSATPQKARNQFKPKPAGGKPKKNQKNYSKPWKKDDKKKAGSPGKTFQGSQSNAGRVNKKKVNKGEAMKKKMVQKVAPKSPKT